MKLLVETIFNDNIEFVEEARDGAPKIFKIKGIFAQAEVRNGNSRVYRRDLLENRVNDYVTKMVKTRQALGELNHRHSPFVDYERASHLVEELRMSGNDVYGVAKILDTPCGRIVKSILSEGIKVGVSTRGLGTVDSSGYVNDDFLLCCVDIVSTPSAPKAIVDTVMESSEYIIQGDKILEVKVNELKKNVAYKDSGEIRRLLGDFLRSI